MKIAIANDHAATQMKKDIVAYLEEKGYEVVNFGTDGDASVDYPEYGCKAAEAVASGECEQGVLICGTGIGISLAANKVPGIRAAAVSEPVSVFAVPYSGFCIERYSVSSSSMINGTLKLTDFERL